MTGSPVEGDEFFGREKELEFAWMQLQNGNSLILPAPRRVGKTSFAKKLLTIAKKHQWNTLELDLQQINTEEAFINYLLEQIRNQSWFQKTKHAWSEKVSQILESIKPSFQKEDVTVTLSWESKRSDIFDQLKSLLNHEENTLVVIDEVTVLLGSLVKQVNGIAKVEFFMNWLRGLRMVTNSNIRWLFCSSVGIENFAHIHAISYTLNDLSSQHIGAFNDDQTKEFLIFLSKANKLILEEAVQIYCMKKIGWHLPYFHQILINKIHFLHFTTGLEITNLVVDKAYQLLLEENSLSTWDERLKDYGLLEAPARVILNALCKVAEGESRDLLLNRIMKNKKEVEKNELLLSQLLKLLRNDGYIDLSEAKKYVFRSPLLRDFWFNRFIQ
ncbi:MAG: ATP-binding protein [Chitinophagaceae bacterium]|nr:ATP-binding protein [Chitinophagaceae bacterium]